ncbi:TIGR04338 family metallohydrolase [Rhodococcus sp. BP-149]|uniref:TIGR04338 family metallohydrolase n=1 Tax=unclassified Rhodococcus (in: high G+C Gram-positive bacteria) TaxID=192944 RepID=UPI001C9B745A|nr:MULTISPECIES: TIGR04338 family metallohydrolase [unclassified Rhodococcus (in: high G+C Gram-positive bacteria)]MBY6684514.1 TIGR04338 family metallohydrolase [Rhodococcus sp. BP-288]MBY6695519.1 TIGR04338 family metallohydrolase [Rhodococcus sp. BP-188]MBY6698900.1 TIGR04338 family metallohydrolase [Rhodococcus sp. BP-285]MBY6701579.1 TIGR04338 family metallohydrolase [Rhodococcus sp. BP-283]MBY6712580.1 TIGR04338 family metallohydrolase [Rhodococcus sp. BP-160]
MTRDSQRSRVYDAEHQVRTMFDRADERGLRTVELLGSTVTLPIERRFASLDSVQTYVDGVTALDWVRSEWPRAAVPVRVRARSGAGAAHYEVDTATIAVPLHVRGRAWALREMVVLHEIAHHLEPGDPDDHREPAHGGAFVDRYLTLVSEIIGAEAGFVLRATMHACGVRIG